MKVTYYKVDAPFYKSLVATFRDPSSSFHSMSTDKSDEAPQKKIHKPGYKDYCYYHYSEMCFHNCCDAEASR